MENLQELAEERAIRRYPHSEVRQSYFIKGFLAHAQLASEDKKELLEALKELHEALYLFPPYSTMESNEREVAISKAQELIKKHETI